MKDNLTDKQKLEIEKYAEEKLEKKFIGGYEFVNGVVSFISGFGLLVLGVVFLFIHLIGGLILIVIGAIFLNSSTKSQEKIKQIRKEKKKKLVKECQLKVLSGKEWKK